MNNKLIQKNEKLYYLDLRTCQCENGAQRIIHLQMVVNQSPYNFINTTRVTESYIPT